MKKNIIALILVGFNIIVYVISKDSNIFLASGIITFFVVMIVGSTHPELIGSKEKKITLIQMLKNNLLFLLLFFSFLFLISK